MTQSLRLKANLLRLARRLKDIDKEQSSRQLLVNILLTVMQLCMLAQSAECVRKYRLQLDT